jgi:TolB-like protein/DNA-binding SARP family transcriptional activator/Flp pilus assembly protein TadD
MGQTAGLLHLKTLGGLSVVSNGVPVIGAAQQRKTLALLALLAAAGKSGLARDKLVGYLWPDADAEHARGLLKQACYALRRDLHQPDLLLGTTQLALNPAIIASDVQAFEDALERRDDAAAAELYAGPFLDGFYLSGAEEFERWLEAERGRLRQRAAVALERLATDAAAAGEHINATGWWRRLAALDPLNSRVALGLMKALAAAGDRAGALQAARVHESLLREELGVALDPTVVHLTERLRAEAERSPGRRRPAAPEPAATQAVPPGGDAATEPGGSVHDLVTAGGTQPSRAAWKRAGVALALVVAGVLTGGWFFFRAPFGARTAETARAPKRIVVLPFTNLGPAGQEYFADGVTEEITARLAAVGDLRVIGSTSAHVYKGTRKTLQEIGTELGVDYVIEGAVRWQKSTRGPARVRVTPQLVSTRDGMHLWAQVYDEPLDEIFRVQSDIAQQVVQALDVRLLDPQRRVVEAVPTPNLQAYDYYLRGNEYWRRGTEERFQRTALRMYEKAVGLDPGFGLAWTRLSRMHSLQYLFYYDRSEDRLVQAKRAVDKAFELEPRSPEAHYALGLYYFIGRADYERALQEFALAEASRPNDSEISLARAVLRTRQGKFREAGVDFEKAFRLDPVASQVVNQYAQHFDLLRGFARAETLYARTIALAPDRSIPYFWKAWMYLRWDGRTQRAQTMLDEARANGVDEPRLRFLQVMIDVCDRKYPEALRSLSETPDVIADQFRLIPKALLYAQVYGLMQRRDLERAYYDSAQSLLYQRVRERPDDPRVHSALGIDYAGLGRKDEAVQEGEKGAALLPISTEANQGYYRAWDLARIYAMVGERDAAVAQLEHLLSIPGHVTVAWLRIDPTWDPLRNDLRFQRLVGAKQ